jgi:hypothetical protein
VIRICGFPALISPYRKGSFAGQGQQRSLNTMRLGGIDTGKRDARPAKVFYGA